LPDLQKTKNGNFYFNAKETAEYDVNEKVKGIKKFGKDKLFIDQFWDFTLNEKVPETIQIMTRKNSIGVNTTTRNSVLNADLFKIIALLTPDEYKVKTVKQVLEGKEDKLEDNKKIKKQMQF
jgi:hypothetical protein